MPVASSALRNRYSYTGVGDNTAIGGSPDVYVGYGPNTRTIMQVVIAPGGGTAFQLGPLQTAFKSTALGGLGVFEIGQEPILAGQTVTPSSSSS